MSFAFILGGLVVAGVFAFVYFQKKNVQSNNTSVHVNNGTSSESAKDTSDEAK